MTDGNRHGWEMFRFEAIGGTSPPRSRKRRRAFLAALAVILPLVVYCCCKAVRREPDLAVIKISHARAPSVRVLLSDLVGQASYVTVSVKGRCVVKAGVPFKRRYDLTSLASTRVERTDGRVRVPSLDIASEAVAFIPRTDGNLTVNGRRYRGSILVRSGTDRIEVINTVNAEGYLAGVVGAEMPPGWPKEALKAQAIAARTYVVYEICRRGKKAAYDVVDSTASQVYRGVKAETDRTIEAVRNTTGQILTYRGKVVKAYYHSTCGGHTASAGSVWGGHNIPPLAGVACDYCRDSKKYKWNPLPAFTETELRKGLASGGVNHPPPGR